MEDNKSTNEIIIGVTFVIFLIAAVVVYVIYGQMAALAVTIMGLLSVGFLLKTYFESWKGKIVRIEREEKNQQPRKVGERPLVKVFVTYAYIKLENDTEKKITPDPSWKVGDVIEKRRGENVPKKV